MIRHYRLLGAAALAACAVPAQALSLNQAASLALQNDPRLRTAGDAVQALKAQVDEARAGYRPSARLSASTGLLRYYLSPSLTTQLPVNFSGTGNPNNATLQASQPLYTDGLTGAQVDACKSQFEGARQSESGARQQLLLNAPPLTSTSIATASTSSWPRPRGGAATGPVRRAEALRHRHGKPHRHLPDRSPAGRSTRQPQARRNQQSGPVAQQGTLTIALVHWPICEQDRCRVT